MGCGACESYIRRAPEGRLLNPSDVGGWSLRRRSLWVRRERSPWRRRVRSVWSGASQCVDAPAVARDRRRSIGSCTVGVCSSGHWVGALHQHGHHGAPTRSAVAIHHAEAPRLEQHAPNGLVHDGDGLCTLSPAGVRQRQFPVLGCQDQWLNASSFQYFGYTAAADNWWLGAPRLLMQEDVQTARVLLAVRTWSLYTSLAVHSNGPGRTIALGWRDMLTPFATEAAAAVAAASELLWRDAIAARLLMLLGFDGFDACAGVPAGEAMPDLLGVSAGCGLVGCRKPGSLMTLRYTHNPARGWDFLADPVLVGVTACEVKGDTGQGQLCVRGGLPPWPDPLRGPSLGLRMFGCCNHALVLSGDATRTWRSRALVPSGDATCTWRSAADDSTDFDAAAWAAWADSLAWLSVAAEDALSHVSMTTGTAAHTAPLCDAARPVGPGAARDALPSQLLRSAGPVGAGGVTTSPARHFDSVAGNVGDGPETRRVSVPRQRRRRRRRERLRLGGRWGRSSIGSSGSMSRRSTWSRSTSTRSSATTSSVLRPRRRR